MGSKGSNTTSTAQQQTYNPAGANYIQQALQKAQGAASNPFAIPQAPVAGFSPDQQNAFSTVNNAQGMAQPFFNQANQYFGQSAQAPNISNFFNPFAGAVAGNMEDLFGQQRSQNTGQLTQAAGGVGADRIAVGQSELAKQQGQAFGQTMANVYAPSLSAGLQEQNVLQGAGYGTAALGSAAQNATLSGANAQLGTGGLQQQLQQAQMNSPYQWQVAQAAFPYQQSQFLSGQVGALAPGLGGTTSGTGTTTGPAPSMLSQILGLGGAGAAAVGYGTQNNGGLKGSIGQAFNPEAYGNSFGGGSGVYGGSSSNPLPGLSPADYGAGFARGGSANPYHFDDGGTVSDKPIDIDEHSFIPTGQIPSIKPQIPSLNLNPPAQSSGSGSGGPSAGDALKMGMQMAMMFAKRGGRIDPKKFDGYNPYAFAEGGDVINPDEPFRMPDQAAVDDWRSGADSAMAFAGDDGASPARAAVARAAGAASAPSGGQDVNPYSPPAVAPAQATSARDTGFAGSPWAALMAAGLATAAGKSPFALTNIGAGGLEGLKTLESQRTASQKDETIDQAAKRLSQEAQFHQDQYTKMPLYQKEQLKLKQQEAAQDRSKPVTVGYDALQRPILGIKDPDTGQYVDPITRKPINLGITSPDAPQPVPGVPGPAPAESTSPPDAALPPNATPTQGVLPNADWAKDVPPAQTVTNPAALHRNESVLAGMSPTDAALVKALVDYKQNPRSLGYKDRSAVLRLAHAYDPDYDDTQYANRNKARSNFSGSGVEARNFQSNDMAIQHIGSALTNLERLRNTSIPAWNRLSGTASYATGNKPYQESLRAFGIDVDAIGNELMRSFRGSGAPSEKEAMQWREKLDQYDSPVGIRSALKEAATLLMGRTSAAANRYNDAMGAAYERTPESWLSKKGQTALQRALTLDPQKGPQALAASPAAEAPPAGQLSPQDQQALTWAKANQNDPRAAQIIQKLGVQ